MSDPSDWQKYLPAKTPLPDGGGEPGVYVVEQWIGAGGMGAVCRVSVTDRGDAQFVAKFLIEDHNVPGFFHEAAWMSSGWPGVVPVLWADQTVIPLLNRPVPLLIMPYYSGGNLLTRRYAGDYTALQAVLWIRQIALALHGLPVVHRDIKPENILLNGRGEAELTDFGIAIPKDVQIRRMYGMDSMRFIGTPCYMAPEQCMEGNQVDVRTDIYALGLVLYEMLTRRSAYPDVLAPEDVNTMKLVSPNTFVDIADDGLRETLRTACAIPMSARYHTAMDFAFALDEFLRRNPGAA